VIGYCVQHKLPIITVLVLGATWQLSAEAVHNIYEECKELGVETGPDPDAFVNDQTNKSRTMALHELPEDSPYLGR